MYFFFFILWSLTLQLGSYVYSCDRKSCLNPVITGRATLLAVLVPNSSLFCPWEAHLRAGMGQPPNCS